MIKDTERVFFELLKAGLWSDINPYIRIDGATDWNYIYRLAQEQSVQGLVLSGIEGLRAKGIELSVPKVLLLQWIGEVQVIEQRNKAMNVYIAEIIEEMKSVGIYTLLVKGQGLAQCYNRPNWRSSGDVDLLLSKDNYEKAKAFILPKGVFTEPEEAGKKHLALQVGIRCNMISFIADRYALGRMDIRRCSCLLLTKTWCTFLLTSFSTFTKVVSG